MNAIDRTKDCFEFDTQEHWAKCFVRDATGAMQFDIVNDPDAIGGKVREPIIETYRGRLCVVIGDASDLTIEAKARESK